MSKSFYVTRNYSDELIGKFDLLKPISDVELMGSVIAPTYVKHANGTIELTEMSLIPAAQAAALIQRGIEANASTEA